jgi:hypothetical protein
MIGEIEAAFQPGIEALALADNEVHRGTEWKIMPQEKSCVVIDASQMQHLTPALWNGTVIFRLSSPALKKDLDAHSGKQAALNDFLMEPAGVIAAFTSERFRLVGVWISDVRAQELDQRWVTEIECRCGLQRV